MPIAPLLTLDDAVQRLAKYVAIEGREDVSLENGLSRVLCEDITAPFAIARYDSAAMDGFAFRFNDMAAERRMELIGRVTAGHPMEIPLPSGKAVQIFTGGVMPPGADTVAIQEDCEIANGHVSLPPHLRKGANRRLAGEDVREGAVILTSGQRLRPQDIGMAAATGLKRLPVHRQVRVAVLATGDELRSPGNELPPGCIYDSNRYAISSALRGLGAQVSDLGLLPDRVDAIRSGLKVAAENHDLVISTGGVSAGLEDHVRSAVIEIGSLDFWKLAIKPGKPVVVGEIAGTPFVGLPGNPVSAMVTFWLIARPILLRLMGATELAPLRIPVVADFSQHHKRGLREYLRARVHIGEDDMLHAQIYSSSSSAMLSSLVWSDGLIEIEEGMGDVSTGDMILFLPYNSLL